MINIGEFNIMRVSKHTGSRYYLEAAKDKTDRDIVLPESETVGRILNIGDQVNVFIYKDSEDRLAATLREPKAKVGEIALLKVVSITKIGAFIDIGIERDVLVPIKEQDYKLEVGCEYLFYIYVDKTRRLAGTTKIDQYLENSRSYRVGDEVTGICYGFQTNGSAMIAVDNKYRGVILKNEYFSRIKPGEQLTLRIKKFYEDDKMNLTPRGAAVDERLELQNTILEYLKNHKGFMPYNDDTSPETIRKVFHQSKKYFKNALGGLMKQGLVIQDEKGTYLKQN